MSGKCNPDHALKFALVSAIVDMRQLPASNVRFGSKADVRFGWKADIRALAMSRERKDRKGPATKDESPQNR